MKRLLRSHLVRRARVFLLIVVVLIAGWWLWSASASETAGTQIVAFGTPLGGIGAAAAAIASWRSAVRSDMTAKRASEALGMAFRPDLSGDLWSSTLHEGGRAPREETNIEIRNRAQWPATNIVFRHDDGMGWSMEKRIDRIDGAKPPAGEGYPENPAVLKFPVKSAPRHPSPLEDPAWQGTETTVSRTTIEYEDERGLIRWCWVQEYESSVGRNGGIETSGGGSRGVTITKLS